VEITDIRIRKVEDAGKLKAIASITIAGEFAVHDIKVVEGQSGLFMSMPSRKMPGGDYKDIAHPILSSTRNRIQELVLEKYRTALGEEGL
jgi:stage V sporulation protein G